MCSYDKNQSLIRGLRIGAVLIFSLFTAEIQAALVVNSATVDGGATTTVAPGATISLSLTVTTSGGGVSNDWRATGWLIAGATGPLTCVNHADYLSSGTFTETFNITAPATAGIYNVYLIAYRRDDCSGGGNSPQFTLANAVTVTGSGATCGTFRDDFSTVSYANQNGSLNWSTNWIEVGDTGSPSSGSIQIAANSLEMTGGGSAVNSLGGPYVMREANLSAYSSATLTLDYRETGNWEANDEIDIYASADGGASWTLVHRFSDDQTNSFQPLTVNITAYIASNTRIALVERADSNGEKFYFDNVQIEGCTSSVLDHFRITPATTTASTCLPDAITIVAEDASNNPITTYTGTVAISTSTNNGNWSVNSATNPTNPNPDNDDNGAVGYTFALADAGDIILNLRNTHAETLTITVTDAAIPVSSISVAIGFSDNVFVITEDTVPPVAGRGQSMTIAMWTNDGTDCFIDTNYDYGSIILDANIDRAGVLPAANDPTIGPATIPDTPATIGVDLDFSITPGQASFTLNTDDVGQYTLNFADNTNTHGNVVISGSTGVLTVRPFGLAVTAIEAGPGPTSNPGGSAPGDLVFTVAGGDFSATVAGVLWSATDDLDNDGVLDTGSYANNSIAPSYAWDTTLGVSGVGFTPVTGAPGVLNNANILLGEFGGGSFTVTDLQYTEVGSFTLQSSATDFLGEPSADIVGEDIVVGRFTPASFLISVTTNGTLAEACVAFTYIGQDFGYATAPVFRATAQNALGATTTNYRDTIVGTFMKLTAASPTITVTQDDTTPGSDLNPLLVSRNAAALTLTNNNDGTVDYTLGADIYRYGPAAPVDFAKYDNSQVMPFPADINPLIASLVDGDFIAASNSPTLDPIGNNQRFGRLRMDNVHGSELATLRMPVFAEFWNGTTFQRNTLDTCTTIADTDLVEVMAAPPGLSVPTVVNAPASAGIIDYDYPAPGAGNDGFVDTRTDLNTVIAGDLWLRFDWDADGAFDDDPVARATFGIYEGNPVQIYLRQTFQ